MNILITGAAGFVGSNILHLFSFKTPILLGKKIINNGQMY